jgi:lysophospholipase L1-like esterase
MRNGRCPALPTQLLALGFGLGLLPVTRACAAETNLPHHTQFEPAIRAFEAADRTNPPPPNAVLLIGSSSIRLWKDAPAQFPSHRLLNRGFGGSHLSDSVAFADRIAIPYRPRVVVLYAGDNDIAAGKSPEQVLADLKAFVAKVRSALPETRIAYLSIKPSPSRLKHLEQFREANRLIREFCAGDDRLVYVDVFTPMLDRDGQPREEFFLGDRLHLNSEGYKVWAGIVGPVLDRLDAPSPTSQ